RAGRPRSSAVDARHSAGHPDEFGRRDAQRAAPEVLAHAWGDGALPDVPVQTGDDAEQDRDRAGREGAAARGPAGGLLAAAWGQWVERTRLLRQRTARGDL